MLFFLQERNLAAFIAFLIVAFFAFAYHELGHALVADRLGDSTPRRHGRITLNPIPHLSLFGMIMLILVGFGWAVTPINPNEMRGNPRTSHAIVAIAGPAFNLIMAALFAIPLRLLVSDFIAYGDLLRLGIPESALNNLIMLCEIGVRLNLFLIGFNLLPIPPLDGFWILRGLLPVELVYRLDDLLPYGTLIFFAVVFILPRVGLSVFPMINSFADTLFTLLVGL